MVNFLTKLIKDNSIEPMEKLRETYICQGYDINLTPKESKIVEKLPILPCQNPSWLMEDRGNLKHTHPHYPGPFTKYKTLYYHLYCSLEKWTALGLEPKYHWDYRKNQSYDSYNPSDKAVTSNYSLLLPLAQRKRLCQNSELGPEIFDDLRPSYSQFFIEN